MNKFVVPFNDLLAQYNSLKNEIDEAIAKVIKTSSFIRGPEVARFEQNFSDALSMSHCVTCGNGTDALYISLKSLKISPEDEVIVPAMSWISTSEAVSQAGGKPIFCDINDLSYTIEPTLIEEKVTSKTVGIIPVHLYGHPCDMSPILNVAKKFGLWVLEDCAQAHLSKYFGKFVGSFGNAGTYSFYPGKNLGAMGDAGAIVTNNSELSKNMEKYARHGGLTKHTHEIEGINSRMDGIQAAILNVKLKKLHKWTELRNQLAQNYSKVLSYLPDVKTPVTNLNVEHSWHNYVICVNERDQLRQHLKTHKIQTLINYPTALPFLKCYSHYQHKPDEFPIAHKLQNSGLSLPLYPEMDMEQLNTVVGVISNFYNKTTNKE